MLFTLSYELRSLNRLDFRVRKIQLLTKPFCSNKKRNMCLSIIPPTSSSTTEGWIHKAKFGNGNGMGKKNSKKANRSPNYHSNLTTDGPFMGQKQ